MKHRPYLVLCGLILVLATGLRCHRLTERSLWLDEAKAAVFARGSITDTVSKTRLANSSPVAHPVLLNLVQRIDRSTLAVRLPSALLSLGAVAVVLLLLPRFGVSKPAAVTAASILAVSPSQVRYAQEAREYALAVFVAAALLAALARSLGPGRQPGRGPALLAVVAACPLVQYGLVLLAGAVILVETGLVALHAGWRRAAVRCAATTGVLTGSAALTTLLTLRGQWRHTGAWYLERAFFEGQPLELSAVMSFVWTRLADMVPYLTLGEGSIVLLPAALGVLLLAMPGPTTLSRALAVCAGASVAAVALAALLHVYPFGAVRQDLFLAPAVAVALGLGMSEVVDRLRPAWHLRATAAFVLTVLAAGSYGIMVANPYQDHEDVKSLLPVLATRSKGVPLYVYYGAWPAIRFYGVEGEDVLYGLGHRHDPGGYAVEFRAMVREDQSEAWLVFSHVYDGEAQRLLEDLGEQWSFEVLASARGAMLYRGKRRAGRLDPARHR